MVPTNFPSLSLFPAPIYCAIMTWPAFEKPIATKVRNALTSPPTDTADIPTVLQTFPTTAISTVL